MIHLIAHLFKVSAVSSLMVYGFWVVSVLFLRFVELTPERFSLDHGSWLPFSTRFPMTYKNRRISELASVDAFLRMP